ARRGAGLRAAAGDAAPDGRAACGSSGLSRAPGPGGARGAQALSAHDDPRPTAGVVVCDRSEARYRGGMTSLPSRRVGASGLLVSAVGLGCNNFGRAGTRTETIDGTREVLDAAIDAGVTFLDTADM